MVQIQGKYISLQAQLSLFVESYCHTELNLVDSQNPRDIMTSSHFATCAGGVRVISNTPFVSTGVDCLGGNFAAVLRK